MSLASLTYHEQGLVRSFNDDKHISQAMNHFRTLPIGSRVLLSSFTSYIKEKFITYFQLLVKESDNHWVRIDENDVNGNVVWDSEFMITF